MLDFSRKYCYFDYIRVSRINRGLINWLENKDIKFVYKNMVNLSHPTWLQYFFFNNNLNSRTLIGQKSI